MIHVVYPLAFGALIACFRRLSSRVKELEQASAAEMLAEPAPDPYGADVESCRKACAELRTDIRSLTADRDRLSQFDAAMDRRVDRAEKSIEALPNQITTIATNAVSSALYNAAVKTKDPV